METFYYIQNKDQGFLGNAPVWWANERRGYTAYLNNAHRFSYEEAKNICTINPNKNKAWPCEYIESKIMQVVDDQHIESENIVKF